MAKKSVDFTLARFLIDLAVHEDMQAEFTKSPASARSLMVKHGLSKQAIDAITSDNVTTLEEMINASQQHSGGGGKLRASKSGKSRAAKPSGPTKK